MRIKTVLPGTRIESPEAQVTVGGSNTTLGTVLLFVSSPPHEDVFVTDTFEMTPRHILLPAFTPVGMYTVNLNAISRSTNWRVNVPLGVHATITAS